MARLYSNENFPLPVVEILRSLGHDVLPVLILVNSRLLVANYDQSNEERKQPCS